MPPDRKKKETGAAANKKRNRIVAIRSLYKKNSPLIMTDRVAVETNFRQYFGMFIGSSKKYGSEEEKFFDALFHDDFSFSAGDKTVMRNNHLDGVKALLSGGLKADVLLFKFIDDTHVEYKLHLTNPDETEMFPHSVGTFKDDKMITLKPFEEQVYVDLFCLESFRRASSKEIQINLDELEIESD